MIALFLTVLIEFFVIYFLLKRKASLTAFSVIVVNLITNPLANSIYPQIGFLEIELWVIAVEAMLLAVLLEIKGREAAMVSICANVPTLLLSLLFI